MLGNLDNFLNALLPASGSAAIGLFKFLAYTPVFVLAATLGWFITRGVGSLFWSDRQRRQAIFISMPVCVLILAFLGFWEVVVAPGRISYDTTLGLVTLGFQLLWGLWAGCLWHLFTVEQAELKAEETVLKTAFSSALTEYYASPTPEALDVLKRADEDYSKYLSYRPDPYVVRSKPRTWNY